MPRMQEIAAGVANTAAAAATDYTTGDAERAAWRVRAVRELADDLAEVQRRTVRDELDSATAVRVGLALADAPRAAVEAVWEDSALDELVTAAGADAPGLVLEALESVTCTGGRLAELLWAPHPARVVAAELATWQPSLAR